MEQFSEKEIKLMSIYSSGTRLGCYEKLEEMLKQCNENDQPLKELTTIVMDKLLLISDEEFDSLDLYGWVKELFEIKKGKKKRNG